MDGLWLGDKILRLIRDKKEQITTFVMQGSTTEKQDYNFMIGKHRSLEEIEDEAELTDNLLSVYAFIPPES